MNWGEIGSAVLPYLASERGASAPWWVVLGIGAVGAVILWAVLHGGAR